MDIKISGHSIKRRLYKLQRMLYFNIVHYSKHLIENSYQ